MKAASVVSSIVRRHMKESPNFTLAGEGSEFCYDLPLLRGERIIGWCQNPPPWGRHVVVFSDQAFYLVDENRVERLGFGDLVGYESPATKSDIAGLRVLTKDGFRFVRLAGTFGAGESHKDAFCFLMVLRAVINEPPVIR